MLNKLQQKAVNRKENKFWWKIDVLQVEVTAYLKSLRSSALFTNLFEGTPIQDQNSF